MNFDVDMIRQMDAEFHGLPLCDKKMTFYYDETGNCGKFSLREDGVNDPTALTNDFILGGIAFDGDTCPTDAAKMIAELRLQSKELKFKNICRTDDFMKFMGSRRASIYVDWLYNSGLYIHFATINNLYYALVDMVDSLWDAQPELAFSSEWVAQIKSALYHFCREHLDEVFPLLYRFHYPNIEKEQTQNFCRAFCDLIQNHNDETDPQGFLVECFRQMLKQAGKHGLLVFLHDNDDDILVQEYHSLYLGRCYTFKYATHHFDYEKVILPKMREVVLLSNGKEFLNYDFIDSMEDVLVQVSDVFVGLLAKLFSYLDSMTIDDIEKMDVDKHNQALVNLAKLNTLINRADTYHPMMIQNVNDIGLVRERAHKLQTLVRAVTL